MLLQEEEAHRCYVVAIGCSPNDDFSHRTSALITVWGVVQSVFGYPSEEAWTRDPRLAQSGSVCEIVDSFWKSSLLTYDHEIFDPPRGSQMSPELYFEPASLPPLRHFFLGSKDVSAQFLGRDLTLELFPNVSFADVAREAATRCTGRRHRPGSSRQERGAIPERRPGDARKGFPGRRDGGAEGSIVAPEHLRPGFRELFDAAGREGDRASDLLPVELRRRHLLF